MPDFPLAVGATLGWSKIISPHPQKALPIYSSLLVPGREERPTLTGNPDPTISGGERNTAAWAYVKVKAGLANTKIPATGKKVKT